MVVGILITLNSRQDGSHFDASKNFHFYASKKKYFENISFFPFRIILHIPEDIISYYEMGRQMLGDGWASSPLQIKMSPYNCTSLQGQISSAL
jgi:hypothetical protein